MTKKGDLSLNVVVVAAIALVVLVVLLSVFASKMRSGTQGQEDAVNNFNTNLCSQKTDASDSTYKCVPAGETGCTSEIAANNKGYIDCPSGTSCCLKVVS